MIKISSFIFLLFLLFSCDKDKSKEVTDYYKNGDLKSIVYLNEEGNREGESKHYKENGRLDYSIFYENGEIAKSIVYYDNGNIHYFSEIIGNDTIKKSSFYNNGKIKMIGNVVGDKRVGWWIKYNMDGSIMEEYEFFIVDNEEYLNQVKMYDDNENIIEKESTFFILTIPDTIKLGKNIGELNYYSPIGKDSERHLYVIISNEYEGGIIKNDTFFIGNGEKKFGIYANKSGSININGTILDRELVSQVVDVEKDSFGLESRDHYKYFKKEVYVKDTL